MHLDIKVDDRLNIGEARLQSLTIALLNIVPFNEDTPKITLARTKGGYAIAIKTSGQSSTTSTSTNRTRTGTVSP